jgi:hypothetical protein
MDYWYHSKTTHEIQELLENNEDAFLYVDPEVDYKTNPKVVYTNGEMLESGYDTMLGAFWKIMWTDCKPATPGVNPYIWFARQPDHPLNCEHPKTHELVDHDIFKGMPALERVWAVAKLPNTDGMMLEVAELPYASEPVEPMVYEELVPTTYPIYYVPVMFYPCVV